MKTVKEQKELMKDAYEYIYVIVNTLRKIVQSKMTKEYEVHWKFIAARKYINSTTKKISRV